MMETTIDSKHISYVPQLYVGDLLPLIIHVVSPQFCMNKEHDCIGAVLSKPYR